MITEERLSFIRQQVSSGEAIATLAVAEALGVSTETIRRDLKSLEASGEIRRVRGGAVPRRRVVSREASFLVRKESNALGKQRIGEAAVSLCRDGMSIFIDIGTTAREVAHHLASSFSGEVITNSVLVACELSHSESVDVLMLPGHLRPGDLALAGASTADYLNDIHVDIAFISCGAIDVDAEITDYYQDEIFVKKTAIKNSDQAFVLADSIKVNVVAKYRVCSFDQIAGVISDKPLPSSFDNALRQQEVRVVTP